MKASYLHKNGHEGEYPMPAGNLAPQNDLKLNWLAMKDH